MSFNIQNIIWYLFIYLNLASFFKKILKVATTVHICSFLATLFHPKLEYLHKKDLTEYLVQLHIFVNEEMEIYPQSFKRNLLSGIHSIQELAYLGVTNYSLHLFSPFRLGKYRLLKMLYAQKTMYLFAKRQKNTQNTCKNLLSYKIGLIANTTAVHTQRHREKEEEEKNRVIKRENLRTMEKKGERRRKEGEGRKKERELMCWNSLQKAICVLFLSSQKLRLPLVVPVFRI